MSVFPKKFSQALNRVCQIALFSLTLPMAVHAQSLPVIAQHPIENVIKNLEQPTTQQTQQKTKQNKPIAQMRIMHIDLDYVFDTDKAQQQRNIQALIQRIQNIRPNTIFLQAFADPDANGSADQVYFENCYMPVRDNLFQQVLQQIRQNTQVQHVYAWLPVLAWELPKDQQLNYVQHRQGGQKGYIRLSPFEQKNLDIIVDIYRDFIQHNPVDGVLYHDDVTLSDYEDSSALAHKYYQQWGFSHRIFKDLRHPEQARLAKYKTAYLDQLAAGITQVLKQYKPNLLVARNMYAPVVTQPQSEQWFAQSMPSTYRYYDYNAIMAMPYMEQSKDHKKFYLDLIQHAKKYDPNLDRTIFELQTVNWRNQQKISTQELQHTIQLLEQHGVKHIGYYPDDFVAQHPQVKPMQLSFQLDSEPDSAQ